MGIILRSVINKIDAVNAHRQFNPQITQRSTAATESHLMIAANEFELWEYRQRFSLCISVSPCLGGDKSVSFTTEGTETQRCTEMIILVFPRLVQIRNFLLRKQEVVGW